MHKGFKMNESTLLIIIATLGTVAEDWLSRGKEPEIPWKYVFRAAKLSKFMRLQVSERLESD